MGCLGCVEETDNSGSYKAAGSFSGVSGILDGGGSFEIETDKYRAIYFPTGFSSANVQNFDEYKRVILKRDLM